MSTLTHTTYKYPHKVTTRIHAVESYRETKDIGFVCRKYHISKASLMRWNKQYDGTKASLTDKSHRPHTPHKNAHTPEELESIKNLYRRNPNISVTEMYGKLKKKGYTRHPGSLYRVLVRLGYKQQNCESTKKKKHNKAYDTPQKLGIKWQLDVKYVPKACYTGNDGEKFYQYTMIDEATRQRFIYAYKEQTGYSTCDFLKRALRFYKYAPDIIQTDNGFEFTNWRDKNAVHIFDEMCQKLSIQHKLIKPRTPQHNGKVERSHRNDQERFYNHLKFYSYDDLNKQMKAYLKRSNNIPSKVLNWHTPNEMRDILYPSSNPRPVRYSKDRIRIHPRPSKDTCKA